MSREYPSLASLSLCLATEVPGERVGVKGSSLKPFVQVGVLGLAMKGITRAVERI
jgi:hypothetical protein